jgi:lipoprotein signal peptidase
MFKQVFKFGLWFAVKRALFDVVILVCVCGLYIDNFMKKVKEKV